MGPKDSHESGPRKTQASSVPAVPTPARLSPEARLAVFSAIVFPAALAPFILLRRSLLSLHHKVDASRAASGALQRDLKTTLLDLAVRRDEFTQLRALATEFRGNMDGVRDKAHRIELARLEKDKKILARLEQLSTSQAHSNARLKLMRDLGISLADVAAFMQEVEIQQGLPHRQSDGRGIERLRYLALQLQEGHIIHSEVSDLLITSILLQRITLSSWAASTRAPETLRLDQLDLLDHWGYARVA